VGQAIHDGIGHDFVGEDRKPIVEGAVARQDDRTGRLPGVDDRVEPLGGLLVEPLERKLVEDE